MAARQHQKVASTADSDAVALMRTFELLQQQLDALREGVVKSDDAIRAASIEFNMIRARHEGIIANNERQRRELEVKQQNVRELLQQAIGAGYLNGLETVGCCATDIRLKPR